MKIPLASCDTTTEFARAYPVQYEKMLNFVRMKGIRERDAHDVVSEAWAVGIKKYEPSKGLAPVQWVWFILENNVVPQYFRKRTQKCGETSSLREELHDPETMEDFADTGSADSPREARELVELLREYLPDQLQEVFETMLRVEAETESKQIYLEVAKRLGITKPECRNLMKRLRRECARYKNLWYR